MSSFLGTGVGILTIRCASDISRVEAWCLLCFSQFVLLQKLVDPVKIERWAVVNFSARCDTRNLVRDLIKCAEMKGIVSLFS